MQAGFEAVTKLTEKYARDGVLRTCSKWAVSNKDSVPSTSRMHLAALCKRLGMKAALGALKPVASMCHDRLVPQWLGHF